MTDEPRPDARDDELAPLLEVPPLDDETRRRLLSRAVDEVRAPAPRRRSRVLVPVAAALVALLLLGVGLFALLGRGGDSAERAGPAGTPNAASPRPGSAPSDASSSAEAAAGTHDLGDLGDVSSPDDLRRAVRAQLDAPAPSARTVSPPCLAGAAAGDPRPQAYGTGTSRGLPVLVLVFRGDGDRPTEVLLDARTCRAVSVTQSG